MVPVIISIDDNEDLTEYFKEVIIVLNKLMFWDFKEKMGKIYLKVFAGVNGLLIPGGATSISHSGYADASNAFFQMAKEVMK